MYRLLGNLFALALSLASFRFAVLTSSNQNETAVHGCNPAISVLSRVGVSQSLLFM